MLPSLGQGGPAMLFAQLDSLSQLQIQPQLCDLRHQTRRTSHHNGFIVREILANLPLSTCDSPLWLLPVTFIVFTTCSVT